MLIGMRVSRRRISTLKCSDKLWPRPGIRGFLRTRRVATAPIGPAWPTPSEYCRGRYLGRMETESPRTQRQAIGRSSWRGAKQDVQIKEPLRAIDTEHAFRPVLLSRHGQPRRDGARTDGRAHPHRAGSRSAARPVRAASSLR